MDKINKYATATAFRRALEDRLRLINEKENIPIQRLRRELAFDRFLARLFARENAPWVLKGGYALELRIKEARATRDIDMALSAPMGKGKSLNEGISAALMASAAADLGDFFVFTVGRAMQELDTAPYGGARFAGIPVSQYPTISREQHFAEKVHAYTLPRKNPNTRFRDLVDLNLLIKTEALNKTKTAAAISSTFECRKTHPIPLKVEPPPSTWAAPYAALAQECGLPEDIGIAFAVFTEFFETLRVQKSHYDR